jgi:glucuronoarabinoxylan endo-1,4-beta-xylanase
VGVEASYELPAHFVLEQNYPNPFNPTTVVRYQLPAAGDVTLAVYDLLGREVTVLVSGRADAGVHEVTFDGSGLSSGVYLYRLSAGDFVQARRLLLLK